VTDQCETERRLTTVGLFTYSLASKGRAGENFNELSPYLLKFGDRKVYPLSVLPPWNKDNFAVTITRLPFATVRALRKNALAGPGRSARSGTNENFRT
jgi:hypothetical protein